MTRYVNGRVCPPWTRPEIETLLRLARRGADMATIKAAFPRRTENAIRAKLLAYAISTRQARPNTSGRSNARFPAPVKMEPPIDPPLAPWPAHAPRFTDVDPRWLVIERIRSPGRIGRPSVADGMTMGGVTGAWG